MTFKNKLLLGTSANNLRFYKKQIIDGEILRGTGAAFIDCQAWGNRGSGFKISGNSILSGCTSLENGEHGFDLSENSEVSVNNSVAFGNARNGFHVSPKEEIDDDKSEK